MGLTDIVIFDSDNASSMLRYYHLKVIADAQGRKRQIYLLEFRISCTKNGEEAGVLADIAHSLRCGLVQPFDP